MLPPLYRIDEGGPRRVVDTRYGMPDGGPARRVGAGETLRVPAFVASDVAAVQVNVTVVDPAADGFVTVFPCGERPWVSTLNFTAHDTVANAATAPLAPDGSLCVYSTAETDLLIDYNGSFVKGGGFNAVRPFRLLDTRGVDGQGTPHAAGSELRVDLHGVTDMPPGASGIALNLTVTEPAEAGYVTAYQCGSRPETSNINFRPGETVPNEVILSLIRTIWAEMRDEKVETFCIYSTTRAHLVVDVTGWFEATTRVSPGGTRLLDTRTTCGAGKLTAIPPGRWTIPPPKQVPVAWRSNCGEVTFTLGGRSAPSDLSGLHEARLVLGASCPQAIATVTPAGDGTFRGRLSYQDCGEPGRDVGPLTVESPTWENGSLVVHIPLDAIGRPVELAWYAALSFAGTGSNVELSAPPKFTAPVQPFAYAVVGPADFAWRTEHIELNVMFPGYFVVNLTAADGTDGGFAVVGDCSRNPQVSTLNYRPGQTRANLAIVPVVGTGQSLCVGGAHTQLLVDVVGRFPAGLFGAGQAT